MVEFKTLEEVINFYSEGIQQSANIDSKMGFVHQGGIKLSDIDKKKIISFLLTMSDSSFVTNLKFSSPY
jgi:cytochrome c peroxidase